LFEFPAVKEEVRGEEPKCSCPRSDETKEQKPLESPAKKDTHRHHEDHGRLEVLQAKENATVRDPPPISDIFFDDEITVSFSQAHT